MKRTIEFVQSSGNEHSACATDGVPRQVACVSKRKAVDGFATDEITVPITGQPQISIRVSTVDSTPDHGQVLWGSSLVLIGWLQRNGSLSWLEGKRVLELGAGCGLVGIAISRAVPSAQVVITDRAGHVLDNLEHNVALNCGNRGAGQPTNATVRALEWGRSGRGEVEVEGDDSNVADGQFDVIVAADVLYDPTYTAGLLQLLVPLLKHDGSFLCVSPESRSAVRHFAYAVGQSARLHMSGQCPLPVPDGSRDARRVDLR